MTFNFLMRFYRVTTQVIVSVVLLVLVVRGVNWRAIVRALTAADPTTLGIGLAVLAGAWLLGAWKWRILAVAVHADSPSYLRFLETYLVGNFYAMFLPGGTAIGEGLKMWRMRALGSRARLPASVLIDRLTGFVGLAVVGCAAFVTTPVLRGDTASRVALVLVIAAGVVFSVVLFWRAPAALISSVVRRLAPLRFRGQIALVGEATTAFCAVPGRVCVGIIIGILVTALWGAAVGFGAMAVGGAVPLGLGIWLYLCASLAMFLPISYAGFGVREGVFVYYLTAIGLPIELALVISLVFLAYQVIVALFGGALEITRLFREKSGGRAGVL